MDSPAGTNPSPSPDLTPIQKPPALAGAIEESRQRLALLIGRLLARRWLRDRHRSWPDRRDTEGPAHDHPA
jgi:hypothetical protein